MANTANDNGMSRRRFAQRALAATAVVATVGVSGSSGVEASSVRAFGVDAVDGFRVHFGDGERFDITVLNADGDELERFAGVTRTTVFNISSENFSLYEIDIPIAA